MVLWFGSEYKSTPPLLNLLFRIELHLNDASGNDITNSYFIQKWQQIVTTMFHMHKNNNVKNINYHEYKSTTLQLKLPFRIVFVLTLCYFFDI